MISQQKTTKGFTLVELVTVIVVLGVLATGVSKFLAFGSRIFAEASSRDVLISSARFAIERLNRELRHAAPNSIEIINGINSSCLIFTPILGSTIYFDLPVSPEVGASMVEIAPFNTDSFSTATTAIVYPLTIDEYDAASDKNHVFDFVDESTTPHWELNFSGNVLFEVDSPTQRLFFYGNTTSYCVEAGNLYRYSGGDNQALMAENLVNYVDAEGDAYDDSDDVTDAYSVIDSTQLRNSTVQIQLLFELNAESITFNNEVQIPNVP